MASIKGGLFVKGKSEEAISNNGAYFVDLTNATESSGTYTIPSADIENGDFTLQVGDLLVDKNSGNILKVATLTPDITADLVVEESSGGGKQLYQHNIVITNSNFGYHFTITINNDNNDAINSVDKLQSYLSSKGFTTTTKMLKVSGAFNADSALAVANGIYYDGAIRIQCTKTNGTSDAVVASNNGSVIKDDDIFPL